MSASTHLNTGDRLAVAQLDDMATQVAVDEPWNSAHAEEWDRQTLDSRLRSHTSGNPECMAVTSAATEAILGCGRASCRSSTPSTA